MQFDLNFFYFFNNWAGKSPIWDAIFIFFSDYFEYALVLIFILAVFLYYRLNRDGAQIFLISGASVVLSRLVITEIIRFLYCRPRPFTVHAVTQLVAENQCSFPSGHAAFFFALAMAVYFFNKKWGFWFFAAATVITISRIIVGVHYPSDILGGAIIGILSAGAVFYLAKRIKLWQK